MTPEEIKQRVTKLGFTNRALAKRFRVSHTTIHFLLNKSLTSQRLEKRLARLLGVTVEELRDNGIEKTASEGGTR
jgi:lambda repressor-like predicted transcriptional regulator